MNLIDAAQQLPLGGVGHAAICCCDRCKRRWRWAPVNTLAFCNSSDRFDGCVDMTDVLNLKRLDGGYAKLLESVRLDGLWRPIEVDRTDDPTFVGDGHHRLAVVLDLGWTHAPVTSTWCELDDDLDRDWL